MADRIVALPGLRVASWRGISFHVYDLSTPAGRRLMSIDLPGADLTIHEDLGILNGPIRVNGIILGDDVTAQARALEAAFNAPGPGTLVHPWFGARTCILTDPGADIAFAPNFLRGLKFKATFLRWQPSAAAGISTLAAVFVAARALGTRVADFAVAADELAGGGIAEQLTGTWTTVLASLAASGVGAELVSVATGITVAGEPVAVAAARAADGQAATAWVTACMGAIAAAGVPPASAAIGIGPTGRASAATVDPLGTMTAMLALSEALALEALEADHEGAALVRLAAALAGLAALVEPLAAVAWESRQQAEAARSAISAAIGTVAAAVIAEGDGSAAALAQRQVAWRQLGQLRRRVHEDLDDRIGRLPSVLTITPPTRVNAWLVAHYVAGDTPKAVQTAFDDIVRRNRLTHPGLIGDGVVEVLPPTGMAS